MTTDEFWRLIARSKRGTADTWEQGEKLTELLKQPSVEEIVEFDALFCGYLQQAYRRELRAVYTIIWLEPSHDSFLYFRAWLIGQGRAHFEAVLDNPENVAKRIKDKSFDGWNEALLTSALAAYEEKQEKSSRELITTRLNRSQARDGRKRIYRHSIRNFGRNSIPIHLCRKRRLGVV